jgi:hypothetical protein
VRSAAGALLVLLAHEAIALAGDDKESISYVYRDSALGLRIVSAVNGKAAVEWTALDRGGRPTKKRGKKEVELATGENALELPVGPEPAHAVSISVMGSKRRIQASRGSWYVHPPALKGSGELKAIGQGTRSDSPGDLFLADGFGATARADDGQSHLEIGRTLGPDGSAGLPVSARSSLVVIAKGSVGAANVILTQIQARTRHGYFEYPINLSTELRRFVIPIDAFTLRGGGKGRLDRVASISLRAVEPTRAGGSLVIDHLALTDSSIRFDRATREGGSVVVRARGRAQHLEGFIAKAADDAVIAAAPVRGDVAKLADPENEGARAWICIDDGAEATACDPPDAPRSSYAVFTEGQRMVIDDMRGFAPVNAFRLPSTVFTASVADISLYGSRTGSSIVLSEPASRPMQYIGYRTPLPALLPKVIGSVEVQLRGSVAPKDVRVGLRDKTGREPKVRLDGYAPDAAAPDGWMSARVPLEAFKVALAGFPGALGQKPLDRIEAVTVALERTEAGDRKLEIREIALVPDREPLVVQTFDGEEKGQTGLGGKLRVVGEGGATLEARDEPDGVKGHGIALEVTGVGGKAYALFSLGVVRVDARAFSRLTLWAKGKRGGEIAVIHLNDGKTKATIDLLQHASLTTQWQKVEIPLAAFGKKINRAALSEISFAWEEKSIPEQTMYLDEIRFE